MIYIITFVLIWYIIGLISLAWAVKFDKKKIKKDLFLYLLGSCFGVLALMVLIFDNFIDGIDKRD
jgi:cell division protein FtsW (lipid II flippase)